MVAASSSLFDYSKLRFERLVKLSRVAVSHISAGPWDHASDFLILINLYADLLAQAFGEGKYSEVAERRLLDHLRACTSAVEPVRPRIDWMTQRLAGDRDCPSPHMLRRLETKKGAVSFSRAALNHWYTWLRSKPIESTDSLIGILSRALLDAALVGRLYKIPVRYVCYSRSRLGTASTQVLDSNWISANNFSSPILVDSHALTGKTLINCWGQLAANARLSGALVTCDETAGSFSLPETSRRKQSDVPWSAFSGSGPAVESGSAAPLLFLAGYPGSGKTRLRKAIKERTGWPAYSWSRVVRPLLNDLFGDLSIAAVERLTKEEQNDPEFIAREFLISSRCYLQKRDIPLVIDGVKSIAAVDFFKRQLGRPATIIRVDRNEPARRQAIESRNAFDDQFDEQRIASLNEIGLSALLASAKFSIDSSNSLFTIGAAEAAFVDELTRRVYADLRPSEL